MSETAQGIFNRKRMQKYEPVLRGVHGTYLFDIDKVGSWFVAVDDGALHIAEKKREADCTISSDEPDFVDIVEGRRHLITSHMQGRVKIYGDMARSLCRLRERRNQLPRVEYPTACSPQAWSAAAPLLFLRSMLGLEPVGQKLLVDPAVPKKIQWLELLGIPGRCG